MKGIVSFLFITTVSTQINFLKLFTSAEPWPWSINTVIKVGNVTNINEDMTSLDKEASKNAIHLLELLRRMFGVGIFPMPPLDPYFNNEQKRVVLPVDEFINGAITWNSLTLKGAKHFLLEEFKLRVNTGRIDYKVVIDELRIINNMETELILSGIPIKRHLDLRIILENLVLSGAFQAEEKLLEEENKNAFQLVGAISIVNTSEVRVESQNLEITLLTYMPFFDKIASLVHQWWLDVKADVERHVLITVMAQINDMLSKLSVEQVKAFLLPSNNLEPRK